MQVKSHLLEQAQPSLSYRATAVVGWSAVTQVVLQVVQFGTLVILARLLRPEDFGLIGMATIVIGFVATFNQLGMNQAIIQRDELEAEHISASFWGSLMVGAAIGLVLVTIAPLIGLFFKDMRLVDILRVTSLGFVLGTLPYTHLALLQRKLLFKEVGIVAVLGGIASSLASVVTAFNGWGVYSLVVGQLVIGPISFMAAHLFEPWRVKPSFSPQAFRQLLSYGVHISAGNLINYATANLDYLLIGRAFGSEALGIYTLAYRVMQTPLMQISRMVPQGLFPVFSEIQFEEERLIRGYLRSTHYVVLVMFPLMASCIVLAPEIVLVFFGGQWLAAAPLIQVLCFAGAMKSAGMNIAIVFNAKGRPDVTWKWNLIILLVYIPLFAVALQWGVLGIAAATSLASVPFLILWQAWLTRVLSVSWSAYWSCLRLPLAASFLMACIMWLFRQLLVEHEVPSLFVLILVAGMGVLVYFGLVLLRDRSAVSDALEILRSRYAWIKRTV